MTLLQYVHEDLSIFIHWEYTKKLDRTTWTFIIDYKIREQLYH